MNALAAKAARGAGAPPAQAADFGRAAACHLTAGRLVNDLTSALNMLPTGPILELPLALRRILTDYQDKTATGSLSVKNYPQLVQSYIDFLPFAHVQSQEGDLLTLTLDLGTRTKRQAAARIDLPDDLAVTLNQLAARTFVPETEASRTAGAGAGLTDND